MNDEPRDTPNLVSQQTAFTSPQPEPPPQTLESRAVAEAMRLPGVEGAGIVQDSLGNTVLLVYLERESARDDLPPTIAGLRVQAQITGTIHAGG